MFLDSLYFFVFLHVIILFLLALFKVLVAIISSQRQVKKSRVLNLLKFGFMKLPE